MVKKSKQKPIVTESSSSDELDQTTNAFAALNDSSSSEENVKVAKNSFTALNDSDTSSEETSSIEESSSDDTSEESSSDESSSDELSESEESSSDESSSSESSSSSSSNSGFFSESESELNVSRWVTVEESSEEEQEGLISKEKKNTAQLIREKWLKKKQDDEVEIDSDDSGDEFTGRLRWMTREAREKFLRDHGLDDLIKSKDSNKKKRERKDMTGKKKQVKFSEVVETKKSDDITSENVMSKFYESLDPRNRQQGGHFLGQLQQFLLVAEKTHEKLKILLALVNAKFDYSGLLASESEDRNIIVQFTFWKEARTLINDIFTILEANPTLQISEFYEVEPEDSSLKDPNVVYEDESKLKGSIVGLIERIDEEFIKLLQSVDPTDMGTYELIYNDEYHIISLVLRAIAIHERHGDNSGLLRLKMRCLDKLYYRPKSVNATLLPSIDNSFEYVVEQCKCLIQQNDQKMAAKACLLLLYHLTINDDFDNAYYYFTHFYYTEFLNDPDLFILYNRTLCQLSLKAFQLAKYAITKELLLEIVQVDLQTLLGQTSEVLELENQNEEFESTEKKRALPLHLHLSVDMIKSTLMISLLILEFPLFALNKQYEMSWFKQQYMDFTSLDLPAEDMTDFVFVAANLLLKGKWQNAIKVSKNVPSWCEMNIMYFLLI